MISRRKELRLIKLIFSVAAILVFISTLLSTVITNFETFFGGKEILPYVQIAFLALTLFVLWFGKESLLSIVLKAPFFKEKADYPVKGNWTLKIMYEDGESLVQRIGDISIVETAYGLQIVGGSVLDIATDKVKVSNWLSEYAEIISDSTGAKIIYTYKTYRSLDSNSFSKIGTVVATQSDNDGVFRGKFTDITLGKDGNGVSETIKQGQVQIVHNNTSR